MLIETPRLHLRPMTAADKPDLREILQDPIAMTAYEHAFTDDEVDAWLEKNLSRYTERGFGLWAVTRREDGAFLGQCGLTYQDIGEADPVLEVGYLFKRRHWGCGYATEAASACLDYAFGLLGAVEVYAIIRDTNTASRAVAERLGMALRGRIIKHYYGVDMPHDIYVKPCPAL